MHWCRRTVTALGDLGEVEALVRAVVLKDGEHLSFLPSPFLSL